MKMRSARDFLQRKGKLTKVETIDLHSTATVRFRDFSLTNDRGETVHGRMRLPNDEKSRFPVAFLVVGLETGREIVSIVEGHEQVIAVGIDYPFDGPAGDASGWSALRRTLALRRTGFRTIPHLLLCLEWLFNHPRVETGDVTMVAVSFGVFAAIPAAVADHRVSRLVVVQGGGNVQTIVEANVRRLGLPVPPRLAGYLGGWLLGPLDPNRYVEGFAPRPLLIVSGEVDTSFPPSSVESLYRAAREPKEWMRLPVDHIMPDEREFVAMLTDVVAEHLYGNK